MDGLGEFADVLEHAVAGFALYASPARKIAPALRELGQTAPVGSSAASSCSRNIAKAAAWVLRGEDRSDQALACSDLFDPLERALLAYTDALVSSQGRVADGVFAVLKDNLPVIKRSSTSPTSQ